MLWKRGCGLGLQGCGLVNMTNAAASATMLVTRLRTTNDDGMSIQMTVLEIIIALLHCLPNKWCVGLGLCRVHIGLNLILLNVGYSVRSGINADLLL